MTASDDLRVLVVSPLGRDAELIKGALDKSGIQCQILDDVASAIEDVRRTTAGALLVTEEALGPKALNLLTAALAEQPAWSDVPVLVLTRGGRNNNSSRTTERRFVPLGTITLLERPMQVATLVSSVKAALRARSRQYERRLAEEALRKSDKLAVVGRLASSIAHEINNPLEAMTNALYLLSGTPLDDVQKSYLNIAQEQLERVSQISAHTLTYNRQSDVRAEASVAEILESVVSLYHPRLTSSGVHVEQRFAHSERLICYPGELRQVFANLIGNAFDATRTGGRIILRERAAVHAKTGQSGIRVTVADTGSGISAEVKARLFEAFNSNKGNQGTGLGLWVSKSIIDKHCGIIRVRSSTREGRSGTVFSIFVPREPNCESESTRPALLQATRIE